MQINGMCTVVFSRVKPDFFTILRPATKEELFNLRHSSLRNAIERIFGVIKRRFKILAVGSEYSIDDQIRILPALCALHNFAKIHDNDDDEDELHAVVDPSPGDRNGCLARSAISPAEKKRAQTRRDEIAQAMWESYQNELRIRGMNVE